MNRKIGYSRQSKNEHKAHPSIRMMTQATLYVASGPFIPSDFHFPLGTIGCGEQEAELRCRALEFYSDQFNRNTDYFDTCDIPPWDRPQCRMITCQNFATSQRPIEELIITPEPCGEDGMRQGVLVTVRNASYQLILNRTFYEPGQAQVGEEVFNIGVEQRSNGVTFGVKAIRVLLPLFRPLVSVPCRSLVL